MRGTYVNSISHFPCRRMSIGSSPSCCLGERMGGGGGFQSPAARRPPLRVPAEEELQGPVLRHAREDPQIFRKQVYSQGKSKA